MASITESKQKEEVSAHSGHFLHGLTSIRERFVDELSCRIEVDTHVEGGGVVCLNAVIGDIHPSVVLRSAAPLALGTVEDVRNAQFGQLTAV